jgi:hypothetical protein
MASPSRQWLKPDGLDYCQHCSACGYHYNKWIPILIQGEKFAAGCEHSHMPCKSHSQPTQCYGCGLNARATCHQDCVELTGFLSKLQTNMSAHDRTIIISQMGDDHIAIRANSIPSKAVVCWNTIHTRLSRARLS